MLRCSVERKTGISILPELTNILRNVPAKAFSIQINSLMSMVIPIICIWMIIDGKQL